MIIHKQGRPPITPRVQQLEEQLLKLQAQNHVFAEQIKGLSDRLYALEHNKPKAYEPRFDHWPSMR